MAQPQYSIIAFYEKRKPLKLRKVTNLYTCFKWLQKQGLLLSVNVYDRNTRNFIIQLKTLRETYQFIHG